MCKTNKKNQSNFCILTIIAAIALLLGIIIFFSVHCGYPTNATIICTTNISADALLMFIGSLLTFIGTVFLGWVAIKQNKNVIRIEEAKLFSTKGFLYIDKNDKTNIDINRNNSTFEIKFINKGNDTISNLTIHDYAINDKFATDTLPSEYSMLMNDSKTFKYKILNINPEEKDIEHTLTCSFHMENSSGLRYAQITKLTLKMISPYKMMIKNYTKSFKLLSRII